MRTKLLGSHTITPNLPIFMSIIALIFLVGIASAGSYSINGTTYDVTWDGRVIPSSQIIFGSSDDTILVQELISATAFTVGNDTIYIHNNFTSFKRDKFKISPVMTFPKTLLASRMINYNTTVAYLVFPYSLSRVKDYISENEIKMSNWTFRAGNEHIDIYDDNETQNILPKSTYTFKIVDDEIRLYFLKAEANKLQGNITFEMNSWTTNGSTTPSWQNTSFDNVTTNPVNIELGISADRFNRADSSNINDNTSGTKWSVSGAGISILDNTAKLTNYRRMTDTDIPYTSSNYNVSFYSYSDIRIKFGFYVNSSGNSYWLYISNNLIRYYVDGTELEFWDGGTFTVSNVTFMFNTSSKSLYREGVLLRTLPNTDTTYTNGTVYFEDSWNDVPYFRIKNYSVRYSGQNSGNLTNRYDSGSGNEVYQIDINATTPENTNYSVNLYNNITGAFIETLGIGNTSNTSYILTIPLQDAKINITLNGNQTASPELMQITFFDQVEGGVINCTDLGSDGIENNIITVSNSSINSNCYTNSNDDGIVINYAINNATAGDTVLFMQNENFNISSTNTISYVSDIVFDGNGSTISMAGTSVPGGTNMFFATGVSNTTIKNFKVNGNESGLTNASGEGIESGIVCLSCDNISVLNNTVYELLDEGIWIINSDDTTISNNTVYGVDHDGIRLEDSGQNIVNNNNASAGVSVIRMYSVYNSIVENNTIDGGEFAFSLYIVAVSSADSSNNIIRNNTIQHTSTMLLGGSNTLLTHNNTLIENNIIYNSSTIFSYSGALTLASVHNITIKNNVVYNTDMAVMEFTNENSSDINILNNIFYNSVYGINNSLNSSNVNVSYSDFYSVGANYGNITQTSILSVDPLFVSSSDFHLKSQYNRWNGTAWVQDAVTSPAIGAGDPTSDNSLSPWGGVIEMGAYGNTAEASQGGSLPNITSWENNKTLNTSFDFTINTSESVKFNITVNQSVTTYNWYVNGTDQSNNFDNFTTSWGTAGLRIVVVNATNGNGTSGSIQWNVTVQSTSSSITVPANSWGMFNNWSTYNTTFLNIASNESNDITYTYYNTTSGEWETYYIGYTYNQNNPIGQHNSVLGFFNAETTITANTATPSDTSLLTGWNMLYVEGTSNRTLATIKTNIELSCTVSDIYKYNMTLQDYSNTLTESLQSNEGFIVYIDSDCTWTRTTI